LTRLTSKPARPNRDAIMSHSGGTVYGQKAKDLLMELKGAEALPAYNVRS